MVVKRKTAAIIIIFLACFIVGALLTFVVPQMMLYATGLDEWEYRAQDQTVIYDCHGQEISRIGYKRIYSDDFPDFLETAVVAVEDRRFYEHASLDPRGIFRALYNDIKEGNKAEGGSTITQQLARTVFLTQERTFSRKFKELILAIGIEGKYSKDEILNMYLNEVYMGRGCSGVAAASRSYFGKEPDQLSQAEITMLVGMMKGPEYYSPDTNMSAVKSRQAVVCDVLVEQGLLTAKQAEAIKAKPVKIKPAVTQKSDYPYLMAYLTDQLEGKIGKERLYQGGLKVYTTIDLAMQKQGQKQVKYHAQTLAGRGVGAKDIALVSVDPNSGAIRALVGGVDWDKNQYNMALLPRQPGSAIKPLYYAAAMQEGIITPETQLNNKPRDFGSYKPQNDQDSYPATVDVRLALLNSYNVASVEVMEDLGVNKALTFLKNVGVTTLKEEDKNLALALGGMSRGISPIQMASAYAIFTNGGIYFPYFGLEKVEDSKGDVLYINRPWKRQAINTETARAMNEILYDVVSYGTGKAASFSIPSAGKTGTTSDSKDLWFVGYTSELVTAVWVGNSDGKAISGYNTYGGKIAAPIWRDYMSALYYAGVFKQKPPATVVEQETPSEEEKPQPDHEQTEQPGETQVPKQAPNEVNPPNSKPGNEQSPEPRPWPSYPQTPGGARQNLETGGAD